ncbi:MAG: GGDEF domain-containing response regulator [Proteobacteria bacterium]|nr:GGDEF domain-containing response regulator [Pseudomonadota bacterium]
MHMPLSSQMFSQPSFNTPLRILLVEDSAGDMMLIKKALERTLHDDYTVECATSVHEATIKLAQYEFDIALLDRSLPDADGFSGLHTIQNTAPHIPVIFLTAFNDEHTAFEAIEQGAQDYILKDKIDSYSMKRALQYAILRKHFEGLLIMRANFDMQTGLVNRTLFESRLTQALARIKRHGGNLAILFIDLNRFKQVNDTLGHEMGDTLLKEVGARLKRSLRPYDTTARFGGDEFAILLESITHKRDGGVVAQKIIERLDEPFVIAGHTIGIGLSIGISTCSAEDEISMAQLIKQADAAMYAAKSDGYSSYCYYGDTPDERLKRMG